MWGQQEKIHNVTEMKVSVMVMIMYWLALSSDISNSILLRELMIVWQICEEFVIESAPPSASFVPTRTPPPVIQLPTINVTTAVKIILEAW